MTKAITVEKLQQRHKEIYSDDAITQLVMSKGWRKKYQILQCLKSDARMKLTKVSKKTGIPIASCFDHLQGIKEFFDLRLVLVEKSTGRKFKMNGNLNQIEMVQR